MIKIAGRLTILSKRLEEIGIKYKKAHFDF
ncbi:unknown protein [Parachlamydia acanthamoebae UV-7]|jgi:hypothetical protein|uniref:Uncharacterized protein n=1 Tax=Parachlamydia acanthamoebae (strain UV7) TaxID=765952 RepID=F8KW02_PARAV|nr:unknown protein [Parachlamydia acanthamoebae UV-7]